ncbi:MAG: RodZ domain-containing protein [Patescibacteria group bacterium]
MRNGFTTKSIGAQTLAEKLKEIRERHDISLEKLARILNIRKDYLEALEQGQYHKLPAEVYIHGYLKSLADYFGLDFFSLLNLYKKEVSIEAQIKTKKEKNKKITPPTNFVITPRILRLAVIIVVVLSLFGYLWYEFSGLSRPPRLIVFEPQSDRTISEETITIVGQTDSDATLSINDQFIYIDPQGRFSEKIGLQKGLNIIKIKAQNRLGRENVIERKIVVEKPKKRVTSPKEQEKVFEGLEMIVTIKSEATWLTVKTDDKEAYAGTMLADSRQVFRAKEKITLSTGKASATYIILNGKDLGALEAEGDVVRDREFTR